MAQPSVHGRFIWQELMTDDTAGAADFYAKVIGWQVQAPAHPNGDYSVFATGQHPVGGVMSLPQHARDAGARPHWLPYIGADDVDGTVGRVEKLGGKVLRAASDVPDVGRYAVLADPQGAAFGVYRPLQAPAAPAGQPAHGEFAWQELATTDFEAAFRFYGELFGWQSLQRMDMGPAGTYLIFGRNGVRLGGIYKLSAQMPAPYWLSYMSVADVDAAAGKAREQGARVINGPMDVPDGGRIAQLLDRSGVLFAIHSHTGATQAQEPAAPKRPAKRAAQPSASEPPAAETASPAKRAATPASPVKTSPAKPNATPASSAPASERASGGGQAAGRPAGKVAKKAAKKAPRKAPAKKKATRAAKKAAKKVARKAVARRGGRSAGKTARRAAKKVAKRAGKKPAKKAAKKAGKRGGRGRGR